MNNEIKKLVGEIKAVRLNYEQRVIDAQNTVIELNAALSVAAPDTEVWAGRWTTYCSRWEIGWAAPDGIWALYFREDATKDGARPLVDGKPELLLSWVADVSGSLRDLLAEFKDAVEFH